ncbi:MAG: hypothetical protein IT349_11840 [Candidatus Eisenbacteria bacterium]|nr:hypothetical protein [Candidatus Eisenbacteria bacterium]MCC7142782.1 hypothetical protein [Candidatus Eisenbacteria bacterium]
MKRARSASLRSLLFQLCVVASTISAPWGAQAGVPKVLVAEMFGAVW